MIFQNLLISLDFANNNFSALQVRKKCQCKNNNLPQKEEKVFENVSFAKKYHKHDRAQNRYARKDSYQQTHYLAAFKSKVNNLQP